MSLSSRIQDLSTSIASEISKRDYNPYRRSVVMSLPIRFPGYTTVLTAKSYTYLFPQGFCYDVAANQLFIMYGSSNSMPWVSVHNATTGAYISGFSLDRVFGESIKVVTISGVRYLYMTSTDTMCRWTITTLPANQATITPTTVYNINAFSHFTYQSGQFVVQTRGQANGGLIKNWFTRWNETFTTKLGEVRFDPSDQWTIDAALIPLNPKAQNMTEFRDGFAVGYGGGHVPGTTTWTPDKLVGAKTFDQYGNVQTAGLCDPNKFSQVLIDAGYPVSYLETEGVADYNGELRALYCTNAHDVAAADTRGILITREGGGTLDFSGAAAAPVRVSGQARSTLAIHCPTAGSLWSTLDGTGITTLEGVIEMMRSANLQTFSFITTGITMLDLSAAALPSGMFVEIRTGNFYSWDVDFTTNLRKSGLWISGSPGALTQTTKGMFDDIARMSGGTLTLTGTDQDVPGCTMTVPVSAGSRFFVTAFYDFGPGASSIALGSLNVNGTSQTAQAIGASRGTHGQQWLIENLATGNRVFKLVARFSSGTSALYNNHTCLRVEEK